MATVFEVYADGTLIYHSQSPFAGVKVINPKLILEENSAGSFTCKIPQSNAGYDSVHRLTSEIKVLRDGIELWSGRVIDEKEDFWKNRSITCEGELAYFNDTIFDPQRYEGISPSIMLQRIINQHNNHADSNKRFSIGVVTVTDPDQSSSFYKIDNHCSSLECIQTQLLDRFGGHLQVRKVNGVRYLDYMEEYPNLNSQDIEFGKNLLDFSKSYDLSNFVTVVCPLGERLEDHEGAYEDMDVYLDVGDVNGGSEYVYDQNVVNQYGWISKVIKFNDVDDPNILLRKARRYLEDSQFEKLTLEISAVDLHYMNVSYEAIKLYDKIHCISRAHGMDRYFPVKRIEMPLDNPENTVFTIGDNIVYSSLSSSINETNQDIIARISDIPSKSSVLTEAKRNAMAIMDQKTNGYITIDTFEDESGIHSEALYVADNKDINSANRFWKWNINGFAYYKNKREIGVAITMDGAIVADYITAGTLNADIIKAGKISDMWGNNFWNLETGEFRLSGGAKLTPTGVKIVFDSRSESEANYDYVDVYYRPENSSVYSYVRRTGTNWDDVIIPAKSDFYIFWKSDSSKHDYWGFKITSITYYSGSSFSSVTGTSSSLPSATYAYSCWMESAYQSVQSDHNYYDNQSIRWRIYYRECTVGNYIDLENNAIKSSNIESKAIANGQYQEARSYIEQKYSDSTTYTNKKYTEALGYTDDELRTLNNALNQKEIFNRLTLNGNSKGIFSKPRSDGNIDLYINANYIATGTLASSTGRIMINLDDGYLQILSDSIRIDSTNFKLTRDGTMTANNANINGELTTGDINGYHLNIDGGIIRSYTSNDRIGGHIEFSGNFSNLGGYVTFIHSDHIAFDCGNLNISDPSGFYGYIWGYSGDYVTDLKYDETDQLAIWPGDDIYFIAYDRNTGREIYYTFGWQQFEYASGHNYRSAIKGLVT